MNILIISASNPLKTAGIVAYDYYLALKKYHNVQILVKDWAKYKDENIITIENFFQHFFNYFLFKIKRAKEKLIKLLFKKYKTERELKTENFVYDYYFENTGLKTFYKTKQILKRLIHKPDVIIVLFMTGFINYKNLCELQSKTNAKILLIPMDMAPFTGGCHYAWDCDGYEKDCNNCPAIINEKLKHLSHDILLFKKQYINQMQCKIIAASEYLFQKVKASTLFRNRELYKIFIPINSNDFIFDNKKNARKKLNLPQDKKIIFIGAIGIKDKRKGFDYLINSLRYLFDISTKEFNDKIQIVIAANYNEQISGEINYPQKYFGYFNIKELPLVFQASDVFLNASIEDAGPMMINQSLMCGTPVVAFNMGVASELVITNKTGYLAELKNIKDFAHGVKYILELNDNEYDQISKNCREYAMAHYSYEIVANNILKII